MEASFQKKVFAVGPMPPVAENSNGEKHALSTSRIRSLIVYVMFLSLMCYIAPGNENRSV